MQDLNMWGAIETLHAKKGVCGDFAELMITLLRIQNIPARIVKGFVLKKQEPNKDDIFRFHTYWQNELFGGENLGFHFWIEYYVPNLGWLPCDPTWSDSGRDYFNTLDCIHFRVASGSWFSMPRYPFLENHYISLNPIECVPLKSCTYDFIIEITVLNSDFKYYRIQMELFVLLLTLMFAVGIILNIKSIKKIKMKLYRIKFCQNQERDSK